MYITTWLLMSYAPCPIVSHLHACMCMKAGQYPVPAQCDAVQNDGCLLMGLLHAMHGLLSEKQQRISNRAHGKCVAYARRSPALFYELVMALRAS